MVADLRRSRISQTLLLLSHIVRTGPHEEASALLAEAQAVDPSAVQRLLAHPWTAVWAVSRVRQPGEPAHWHVAEALALAAAARAGLSDRGIRLVPTGGSVTIPGLGRLRLARPAVRRACDLTGRGWEPVRHLDVEHDGARLTVSLDDVDPYRDCHGLAVTGRLRQGQVAELTGHLGAAWRLLVTWAPTQADELAVGLSSITLLRNSSGRPGLSATSEDAFGGLATTMPPDGLELAGILVHEFGHSKLAALNSLTPLARPGCPATYFAPWRPDPRPVLPLMHGTFAFTAVAALWRDLMADPAHAGAAVRRFAVLRAQLRRALQQIGDDQPHLTVAGRRLIASLRGTVDDMGRQDVPRQVEADASAAVAEAEARFRAAAVGLQIGGGSSSHSNRR